MAISRTEYQRHEAQAQARVLGWHREWPALLGLSVLWAAVLATIIAGRRATWMLEPQELDLVRVLPITYWLWLGGGTLAGTLALWWTRSESVVTACVVGLTFVYVPGFLLTVFPGLADWDSFIHASPARNLLLGKGMGSANFYAPQYPAQPTILALIAGVTGIPVLSMGVLLTVLAELCLVLLFMGIARVFLGLKASAWTSLAILALTPVIANNNHFSPFLLGQLAMWATVLMVLLSIKEHGRPWIGRSICAMLLAMVPVMSHPFMPIITTMLFVGVATWSWRERWEASTFFRWFVLMLVVATVSWTIYAATYYFTRGMSFFRQVLIGSEEAHGVIATWTPLSIREVLRRASPGALTLILTRWSVYLGVGLVALTGLLLRSQRKTVMFLLWLVVTTGSAVGIGLASKAPWIQRIFFFAPPELTLASGVAVSGWMRHFRIGRRGQLTGVLIMAATLLVGLFLWHPPVLLYSVHPAETPFIIWPHESAAIGRVASTLTENERVGADLQSMIIFSYFNPDYPVFRDGVSMGSNLQKHLDEKHTLFYGDWVIRSIRQEMMAYQAQDVDPSFWNIVDERLAQTASRTYDNGFVAVYRMQRRK